MLFFSYRYIADGIKLDTLVSPFTDIFISFINMFPRTYDTGLDLFKYVNDIFLCNWLVPSSHHDLHPNS